MALSNTNSHSIRRGVNHLVGFLQRHWRFIMLYEAFIITTSFILFIVFRTPPGQTVGTSAPAAAISSLVSRAWGGFNRRPLTETCYRQERTAILFSIILGTLAVDQFYTHHWILGTFKLLSGFIALPFLILLLGLGSKGAQTCVFCLLPFLIPAGLFWAFIDVVLWVVGGIYRTPGCPGRGGR